MLGGEGEDICEDVWCGDDINLRLEMAKKGGKHTHASIGRSVVCWTIASLRIYCGADNGDFRDFVGRGELSEAFFQEVEIGSTCGVEKVVNGLFGE